MSILASGQGHEWSVIPSSGNLTNSGNLNRSELARYNSLYLKARKSINSLPPAYRCTRCGICVPAIGPRIDDIECDDVIAREVHHA